jgi:hypothetical protein
MLKFAEFIKSFSAYGSQYLQWVMDGNLGRSVDMLDCLRILKDVVCNNENKRSTHQTDKAETGTQKVYPRDYRTVFVPATRIAGIRPLSVLSLCPYNISEYVHHQQVWQAKDIRGAHQAGQLQGLV